MSKGLPSKLRVVDFSCIRPHIFVYLCVQYAHIQCICLIFILPFTTGICDSTPDARKTAVNTIGWRGATSVAEALKEAVDLVDLQMSVAPRNVCTLVYWQVGLV